jgi:hypothetical protein
MHETCQKNSYETGYVYFVLDVGASMVKIGYTAQIESRRFGQISSPYGGHLQLLGVMPGGAKEEAAIHAMFKDERDAQREWFRLSNRLSSFIASKTQWVESICSIGQHQLDGTFRRLNYSTYPQLFINGLPEFVSRRSLSVMEIAITVGCFPSRVKSAIENVDKIDVPLFTAICHHYKVHPSELVRYKLA